MEQITAGFSENDNIKDLFLKYKDAFGHLFLDGSRFLCDQDYQTLYTTLASFAKWNKKILYRYDDYHSFSCNLKDDETKFFYCIFGIYLREATYRYAADVTDAGAFWSNLQEGILHDLQLAYQAIPGQEQNSRIENRGYSFWYRNGSDIQNELTKNGSTSLIRKIFNHFDNPYCRISSTDNGGNVYVKHLTKIAGCPLNCNPVRNSYADLRLNRTRNALERFVNEHKSAILDYAYELRPLLTDRICDYFNFLGDLYTNSLDKAREEMQLWCGITNRDHYYYSWLQEEFQGFQHRLTPNNAGSHIQREYQNTDFEIFYNTLNNRVSISCPDPAYIANILRQKGLVPKYTYNLIAEGSILLKIAPYGHINGRQTISTEEFNRNVFKLFTFDKIQLVEEYEEKSISIDNPWKRKTSLFDHSGNQTSSADETSYLVLSPDEHIIHIEGATHQLIEDAVGGLNVYKINVNNDSEIVSITTEQQLLHFDVMDSRCIYLYQDKKDRKDIFIHQKPRLKFGIGNIQFTHLGNSDFQNIPISLGINVQNTVDSRRLLIKNISNKIQLIPEQIKEEKILPQSIILPAHWNFWMAEEDSRFQAYLKTAAGAQVSPEQWEALENNLYRYKVADYNQWKNEGFPIYFFPNKDISFHAKCPYFNTNTIRASWNNSDFFLGANPFDDVIPNGANYYFSWKEHNCLFKVEADYDKKSLRQCLIALGLWGNIPEITFGWTFNNTKYTKIFSNSPNYHEPERPESVYNMNNDEREKWLCTLLNKSSEDINKLIPYYRFDNDLKNIIQNKIKYGFFREYRDTKDILLAIAPLFFEKNVLSFRMDLHNISDLVKHQWQQDWAALTYNEHEQIINFLKTELQDNGIECEFLTNNIFLWTFVSEADIQHYIKFQLQAIKEQERQKNYEIAKQKIDEFLSLWHQQCDSNLKNIQIEEILLNNKSFGNCSSKNFNEYIRYLNSWLISHAPYIEDFKACFDKVLPEDFFIEDEHKRSIIGGGHGYAQTQVKGLAEKRIELYKQIKLENERHENIALSNTELIEKVLPTIKLEVKPGVFHTFNTRRLNEMFLFDANIKVKLWIELIVKKWESIGRLDLCSEIDKQYRQADFQESLQQAGQSEISQDFQDFPIENETLKLSNHLRHCLKGMFFKEINLWKNAIRCFPSLKNFKDSPPPEIFFTPKDGPADFIRNLAIQWDKRIKNRP